MKKNKQEKYAVTWAEYNHNNMCGMSLQCDLLGIYPTKAQARAAIDSCTIEDVCHELEFLDLDPDRTQPDTEDIPEEYRGKSVEDIAKDWTYHDCDGEVGVQCANGIECFYTIRKLD